MKIDVDPEVLCNKIKEIFPDLGECAIDIKVYWDQELGKYTVILEKGERTAKIYLEDEEVKDCLMGKKCISLALQVGQMK